MGSNKVYEILSNKIIDQLDKGVVPWRKTWKGGINFPKNVQSGNYYKGFNSFILQMSGRTSPIWLTWKQAMKFGGHITKGKTKNYANISYWNMHTRTTEQGETKTVPFIRYYRVYNLDDTTGVKLPDKIQKEIEPVELNDNERIKKCEQIVDEYEGAPEIVYKGNPCYSPKSDKVMTPKIGLFDTSEEYYSALFHELGHSTNHKTRLNRKLSYAKEELVAEMTAFFLCGVSGIEQPVIENQAAYIAGWKDKIKDCPGIVVNSANKGWHSAQWILNERTTKKED